MAYSPAQPDFRMCPEDFAARRIFFL